MENANLGFYVVLYSLLCLAGATFVRHFARYSYKRAKAKANS